MKRLGIAFSTLFALLAMPMLVGANKSSMTKPATEQVFVTNRTGKPIVVKWQTSLSGSMESRVHTQDVGPGARHEQAQSKVEWFKDDTKDGKNDHVYTIFVQVFSEDGKILMSEQTFKKTVSKGKLFGEKAKGNLYIIVASNYSTHVAIK